MIYRYIFLLTGPALIAGYSKSMDYSDALHKFQKLRQTHQIDQKIENFIDTLIDKLAIKDCLIENLQKTNEQLHKENEELKRDLHEKNRSINALKQHLGESDNGIQILKTENGRLEKQVGAQLALLPQNDIPRCAFSPRNIARLINNLISEEKKSIHMAMFRYRHWNITRQWIQQKNIFDLKENMVCVDHDHQSNLYEPLRRLIENGVVVFCPQKRNKEELVHHKFIIFGCNRGNRPLLITGSFNCTDKADKCNWENVCIIQDPETIDQYSQEFSRLSENRKILTI